MPKAVNKITKGIILIIIIVLSGQVSRANMYFTQYDLNNVYSFSDSISSKENKLKSPKFVMLRSAVIPGWGQAVNKQYWKIPIVYAGLGTCVYFISYNNGWYKDFKEAFMIRTDDDPATIDQFDPVNETSLYRFALSSQLQSLRDSYRRNLELSVIAFSGFYLLNLLDAYVGAHLRSFDMSEDLSMRFTSPSIHMHNGRTIFTSGLTITF